MSEFPSLKPAFTIDVIIDAPKPVGSASRSNSLQVVPMTGGSIKAAPGFEPAVNAEFTGVGNDYIHVDADGKHLRLDAHAVAKTNDDALLYFNYKGVITATPAEGAVLSGTAPDGVTPWGNSFTTFAFETGDERYQELENRIFVAQGRFRTEKGKQTVVEYRVSQVVKG